MHSALPSAAPSPRYRPAKGRTILVWFHWLTVVLVLTAAGLVLVREVVAGREARGLLLATHRQLGLLVFILTAARLLLRWARGHETAVDAKGPHRALAAATHATFYLLLGALPVLGLIASQARGQAVQLLGLPLPDLLARDRDLAEQLLGIHEWLAWLFLAMAGMHAVMALWHHWVRGDDTLRRMLPTISVR